MIQCMWTLVIGICLVALTFAEVRGSTGSDYALFKNRAEAKCLHDSAEKVNPKQVFNKKSGCVIYYIHNHKSGGTTMCRTAQAAGHVVNMIKNCNAPGNRTTWTEHISKMNYTFVAQEDPYLEIDLSRDNYLYMTTIRDPYDRMVSDLHHTLCLGTLQHAKDVAASHLCTFDVSTASLIDIVMSDCFQERFWYVSSNYYMRMFTGCHKEQCTMESLQLAKDKLEVMSVIMITDTLDDFSRYSRLLDLKFSMHYHSGLRSGTHQNSHGLIKQQLSVEAWEKLRSLNTLDEQFYTYAKAIAKNQLDKQREMLLQLDKYEGLQSKVNRPAPMPNSHGHAAIEALKKFQNLHIKNRNPTTKQLATDGTHSISELTALVPPRSKKPSRPPTATGRAGKRRYLQVGGGNATLEGQQKPFCAHFA